tara:strand:- start:252 stop:1091 length:840 start_codon:yes stop_codon:yes gene_type:complete
MSGKKPTTLMVVALWSGNRRIFSNVSEDIKYIDRRPSCVGPIFSRDEILKRRVKVLMEVDHGEPMDTIFVNPRNDENPCYKEYLDYLNSLNGQKTKNGNIIVEHRENTGISFGSMNYAWQKYKDDYDYFYFTEDDYVNISEGFVGAGVNILKNNPEFGMVATLQRTERKYPKGNSAIYSNKALKLTFGNGNIPHVTEPHLQHSMRRHTDQERRCGLRVRNAGYDISNLPEGFDVIEKIGYNDNSTDDRSEKAKKAGWGWSAYVRQQWKVDWGKYKRFDM